MKKTVLCISALALISTTSACGRTEKAADNVAAGNDMGNMGMNNMEMNDMDMSNMDMNNM